MIKLYFNIKKQETDRRVSIYLRIKNGRKYDFQLRTELAVFPKDWDSKLGRPKTRSGNMELAYLRDSIQRIEAKIYQTYSVESLLNGTVIEKNDIRKLLYGEDEDGKNKNLLKNHILKFLAVKKTENKLGNARSSTINTYEKICNRLLDFERYRKASILTNKMDKDFIDELKEYLITIKEYNQNTVNKTIGFLKTLLFFAEDYGAVINKSILKEKAKTNQNQNLRPIYFTTAEIQRIQALDLSDRPFIDAARDWLLISCETGQRVSDFPKIANAPIEQFDSNTRGISIIQEKTGNEVVLPITNIIDSILQKRMGNFPPIGSSQKYNENIKQVCKLAGLTELVYSSKVDPTTNRKVIGNYPKFEVISSHTGRRIFATNNILAGFDQDMVMTLTGHKTVKEFCKYLGFNPKEQKKGIAIKFNEQKNAS